MHQGAPTRTPRHARQPGAPSASARAKTGTPRGARARPRGVPVGPGRHERRDRPGNLGLVRVENVCAAHDAVERERPTQGLGNTPAARGCDGGLASGAGSAARYDMPPRPHPRDPPSLLPALPTAPLSPRFSAEAPAFVTEKTRATRPCLPQLAFKIHAPHFLPQTSVRASAAAGPELPGIQQTWFSQPRGPTAGTRRELRQNGFIQLHDTLREGSV